MSTSVPSTDAPYGRIGSYAFSSAKQAEATKQALDNAANSDKQKGNDAALAKLKAGADSANQVYGGSSSKATASAAVTAQNISETSTKDAPYGKIGNSAFSSAEQASKVKEALGKAQAGAPANPLASSSAQPNANANASQAAAQTQTAKPGQSAAASSKDSPYGKIGNFSFSSAEQAAKVKEALGSAGASMITEAGKSGASNSSSNAQASQAAVQLSADDQKTAKAFETLAKANAAYRNFALKGIDTTGGSSTSGTKA